MSQDFWLFGAMFLNRMTHLYVESQRLINAVEIYLNQSLDQQCGQTFFARGQISQDK
jgi:hypothetical protein